MSGAFQVMICMRSYGPDDQLCFRSTMSHMRMRMGRGTVLRLAMAWRVLEYSYDNSVNGPLVVIAFLYMVAIFLQNLPALLSIQVKVIIKATFRFEDIRPGLDHSECKPSELLGSGQQSDFRYSREIYLHNCHGHCFGFLGLSLP